MTVLGGGLNSEKKSTFSIFYGKNLLSDNSFDGDFAENVGNPPIYPLVLALMYTNVSEYLYLKPVPSCLITCSCISRLPPAGRKLSHL